MILHNRRKKNAFFDEQHKIYSTRLIAAIETQKAGIPLSQDQLLILSREKTKFDAEEERKQLGVWARTVRAVKGGMTMGRRTDQIVVPSEAETLAKIGVSDVGVLEAVDGKANVNQKGEITGVKPLVSRDSKASSTATVAAVSSPPSPPKQAGEKKTGSSRTWWDWFNGR